MLIEKGDLILVSEQDSTKTCIVLTIKEASPRSRSFYYTYCLESGLYGITYDSDILSIVSKGFAPDFEFDSSIFDTNYNYYSELYQIYSYYPNFYPYEDLLEDFFDDLDMMAPPQQTGSIADD